MLWLSLYFPHLALDMLSRANQDSNDATFQAQQPLVVHETLRGKVRIYRRNRAAAKAGITIGMDLGAALSLCETLQLFQRDPVREQQTLHGLASWAGQFSPMLSLQPPLGLLLEISASLTLFGGLARLMKHIRQGVTALGYHLQTGIAPTPLGSWLLCRAGIHQAVTERRALQTMLLQLPAAVLAEHQRQLTTLHGLGIRTLEDCQKLPRAALARRLGPSLLHNLDRALGDTPDPRPCYQPPQQFYSQLLLPSAVDDSDALVFAARRLLLELQGFLRARGQGIQKLHWLFEHHQQPATALAIGLLNPSRDPEHLLGLLRQRLEALNLPAPVEQIVLRSEQLFELPQQHRDLFNHRDGQRGSQAQLLERLQGRLSADRVCHLATVADHRPERAWRYQTFAAMSADIMVPQRPIWFLATPQPLQHIANRPQLNGELMLRQGPERIETGWWDEHPVARDYFIAENSRHERFWIFREQRPTRRAWFLHGIFA